MTLATATGSIILQIVVLQVRLLRVSSIIESGVRETARREVCRPDNGCHWHNMSTTLGRVTEQRKPPLNSLSDTHPKLTVRLVSLSYPATPISRRIPHSRTVSPKSQKLQVPCVILFRWP